MNSRKRSFKEAVSKKGRVNLIAEIKKASPSKGILREDFDPASIAKIYEKNDVSAISILTETEFFLGKPSYIKEVRKVTALPILRKDFIIDENQIYESAKLGADAILLIANLLPLSDLKKIISIAESIGLDVLLEIHDKPDLKKALASDAEIIGINNRDLKTFKVDLKTTQRLIKDIPKDRIIVSESGVETRKDFLFLKNLGVNAVLIGEAFMRSPDIAKKIKEIIGDTTGGSM